MDEEKSIEVGRLLRSGVTGFVAGCKVAEKEIPRYGALVTAPLGESMQIYGIIYDVNIDDDGLVRQLVSARTIDEAVIQDNRVNRNVPMEVSVLAVGYEENGKIWHLLPPRAPLSLDRVCLCTERQVAEFTGMGRFGYFRHILRNNDLPISELLAAHIQQSQNVHRQYGNGSWASEATKELITLLRDDYPTLMAVLGSLADAEIAP
ncbi:MAG: hypothetical protein JXA19_02615 [Anaerolineales bacterium]|nr:hypothetical protein [Anaerolineales bacterium]